MSGDVLRHPAWPNSRTNPRGGWAHPVQRRPGRVVDTATVRAIEAHFGIPDMEDWMLRAYYLRGLTYREIADEIGVSEGTVATWFGKMGTTARMVAFEVMRERLEDAR